MARKVDVASIKSDYESFRQEQGKMLSDLIVDLKSQRGELDAQIAHLESVVGQLHGTGKPAAKPAGKR